jgi:hypothetical protein
MGRLERFIDRRTSVEQGEVTLTEEARWRAFAKPRGPVVVPDFNVKYLPDDTKSRPIPEGYQILEFYEVTPSDVTSRVADDSEGSRLLVEQEDLTAGMAVADESILGNTSVMYDSTFVFLRSPAAQKRVERIRKRAARVRLVAVAAGVAVLGAVGGTVAGATDAPIKPAFIRSSSCDSFRGPTNGEELLPKSASDQDSKSEHSTCTLNGQEYLIVKGSGK